MPIIHTRQEEQMPAQLQFPVCLQKLASPGKLAAAGCWFCLSIEEGGGSFNFAEHLYKSWSEKHMAVGGHGEGKRRERTL